uniref:Disco interacting A n=1 Tax=Fundulus heteroclitus TaxID=8078 RepID=A0A3Q2P726_FUNHE
MHTNTLRTASHGQANDSSLSAPPSSLSLSLSFSLCLFLYLSVSVCTGDITQKGYEKKRSKLLAPYIPQIQDLHTEAVQAALAKYKERKMPMPSKRRSVLVQSSVEACTPPDTSSASEDEGSLRRQGRLATSTPYQGHSHPAVEHWFNRVIQGSSTSSSASSTSSHPGGRSVTNSTAHAALNANAAATALADLMAHTQLDNHSAPPDVTGLSERSSIHLERPQVGSLRGASRSYNHHASMMETADGVPVNSRVSNKIQQLLNTLKRPKRPPLREFFVDDFEELLDVQQPDPNQPRPEGQQMSPLEGEPLGVVTNWPPSLPAALHRWGTTHPKSPCLTALDNAGKPVYTLTYGKLWTRSQKLAYTLLNKLSSRNEPLLMPGDRVALVFPNSDPVMFMVAFFGCLLAELVPVPIEVPLTRKDAGSQQIGFLLGSCGVTLALTTDACQKGLPKAQTGEVATFKGWPRLLWFVTDGKHVVKPPKDWHPPIREASNDIAYIEYKTSKEGSTMGITVSHSAMLAHCQALTQACGYTEGETITNVLDFKREAGLWHGVLTVRVVNIPTAWCCHYHLRLWEGCVTALQKTFLHINQKIPPEMGVPPPGKAVLSMSGLSHSVIRVDTEEKLSVLTVQDVGQVMPGALVCVVRVEGTPFLCQTDEVGEICVSSGSSRLAYYGLPGMTKNIFETVPVKPSGVPISDRPFTRTSLLGFVGPDNLVFVVGKMEGLMVVSSRRHNADDVVATALAVEPMKFVYRGRIAVFSVSVLHDERIVVVAEQRPDSSEEDSFQWMSRVLQVPTSSQGLFLPSLIPLSTLSVLSICDNCEPKYYIFFLFQFSSEIPSLNVMCVSVFYQQFLYIQDVLQWRAQATPDHPLFLVLNSKGTVASTASCLQLHKRAERVAAALMGRLNTGDHVALVYPPGIDLIATFYGCLYAGCVPVTVRPPHPQNLATTLPTVKMIVEVSKSVCILTTQAIMKLLKSKEATAAVDIKSWPTVMDTDDLPRKKCPQTYKPPTPEMLAYLDFSVSTTGILAGVKMSHSATSALCRSIKLQCELYPSRQIAICLDPYCGLGLALWCLCSVYSGHQSILVPPLELESNASLWLAAVSQYKVRVTFCSYSVMEMCTKGLGSQTEALRLRNVNLSCVRTCMVVAEERPRITLTQSFSKIFKDLGLSPRAVSTTFGCRVNVAICLQGTSGPDPTTVYVDMRALRHDRVRLVERGSPHSLPLMESGKILPGVKVIIANTETKGPLGDSHLGEVWVSSPHNATGYYTVYGEEALHADHFNTKLSFGDTQTVWARTGYLGFLRRTDLTDASGERHDALYVVGSLDETLELRGMRYHPIDIETSVIRAHKSIAECAVFTWTNLLVVVVELEGSEQEALDLVALVTNVVLEEHYLIVGVVVVVDPGVIPINSRGEKQRMHLRDGFLADQLDPIYVAYNM